MALAGLRRRLLATIRRRSAPTPCHHHASARHHRRSRPCESCPPCPRCRAPAPQGAPCPYPRCSAVLPWHTRVSPRGRRSTPRCRRSSSSRVVAHQRVLPVPIMLRPSTPRLECTRPPATTAPTGDPRPPLSISARTRRGNREGLGRLSEHLPSRASTQLPLRCSAMGRRSHTLISSADLRRRQDPAATPSSRPEWPLASRAPTASRRAIPEPGHLVPMRLVNSTPDNPRRTQIRCMHDATNTPARFPPSSAQTDEGGCTSTTTVASNSRNSRNTHTRFHTCQRGRGSASASGNVSANGSERETVSANATASGSGNGSSGSSRLARWRCKTAFVATGPPRSVLIRAALPRACTLLSTTCRDTNNLRRPSNYQHSAASRILATMPPGRGRITINSHGLTTTTGRMTTRRLQRLLTTRRQGLSRPRLLTILTVHRRRPKTATLRQARHCRITLRRGRPLRTIRPTGIEWDKGKRSPSRGRRNRRRCTSRISNRSSRSSCSNRNNSSRRRRNSSPMALLASLSLPDIVLQMTRHHYHPLLTAATIATKAMALRHPSMMPCRGAVPPTTRRSSPPATCLQSRK